MKKSPAFQLYAAEFLSDENVVLMDNRQLGCYLRLLLFCWIEGSIPNSIDKIARLCFEKKEDMEVLWEGIKLCFNNCKNFPNRLIHKRLELERMKQEKFRKERSDSGKRGAKSREFNKLQNKLSLSSASTKEKKEYEAKSSSSSSSSSSKIIRKKYIKKENVAKAEAELLLPSFLNTEDWSSFLEHRKNLRKPMSAIAQKRAFTFLEKLREEGHDVSEIISRSIVNGWIGLFPIPINKKRESYGNALQPFGKAIDSLNEKNKNFFDTVSD